MVIFGLGAPVQAEELKDRFLREYRVDSEELGIAASGFRIEPSVELSVLRDSNVLAESSDEQSDRITVVRPSVRIRRIGDANRLNLIVGGEIARYDDLSDENYQEYSIALDSFWSLAANTSLGLALSTTEEHEERTDPAERNGIEPTMFDRQRIGLKLSSNRQWARIDLNLAYVSIDFDDTKMATGSISNRDRNHDITTAGLTLVFQGDRTYSPYARVQVRDRNFGDVALGQLDRSSDNSQFNLGLEIGRDDILTSDLYVGYERNEFDQTGLSNENGFIWGARVDWSPRSTSKVTAHLRRGVDVSTLVGSAVSLKTEATITWEMALRDGLKLRLNGALDRYEYQGLDRDDDVRRFGLDLRRVLTPRFVLTLSYVYQDRDVSPIDTLSEFDRSLVSLTLRGRL